MARNPQTTDEPKIDAPEQTTEQSTANAPDQPEAKVDPQTTDEPKIDAWRQPQPDSFDEVVTLAICTARRKWKETPEAVQLAQVTDYDVSVYVHRAEYGKAAVKIVKGEHSFANWQQEDRQFRSTRLQAAERLLAQLKANYEALEKSYHGFLTHQCGLNFMPTRELKAEFKGMEFEEDFDANDPKCFEMVPAEDRESQIAKAEVEIMDETKTDVSNEVASLRRMKAEIDSKREDIEYATQDVADLNAMTKAAPPITERTFEISLKPTTWTMHL